MKNIFYILVLLFLITGCNKVDNGLTSINNDSKIHSIVASSISDSSNSTSEISNKEPSGEVSSSNIVKNITKEQAKQILVPIINNLDIGIEYEYEDVHRNRYFYENQEMYYNKYFYYFIGYTTGEDFIYTMGRYAVDVENGDAYEIGISNGLLTPIKSLIFQNNNFNYEEIGKKIMLKYEWSNCFIYRYVKRNSEFYYIITLGMGDDEYTYYYYDEEKEEIVYKWDLENDILIPVAP